MALSTIDNSGHSKPLPAPTATTTGNSPSVTAPAPAVVSAPVPQQPTPEQVRSAVESLRQMVQATAASKLDFSIDDDTGKTVVRVTDAETGEMIRQIPSEELLELARSLDRMQGLMLQEKA